MIAHNPGVRNTQIKRTWHLQSQPEHAIIGVEVFMRRRIWFWVLHYIFRRSTAQIAKNRKITRQRVWQILKGK